MRHILALTSAASDRLWDLLVALTPILAPTLGGSMIAWMRARRRRLAAQSAARARDKALLYAGADLQLVLAERALWQEWLTATGRHAPRSPRELAEQAGAYRQRLRSAVDLVRSLAEVPDRRTGPRDTQRLAPVDEDRPQDMFAPGDTGEERGR